MNFHSLKVSSVKKETNDAVIISFDIDDSLKNNFSFNPGQYITVKANINGQDIRRSYSICSKKDSPKLSIGVKAIKDGVMSNYLCKEINEQTTLSVSEPEGKFSVNNKSANTLVLFAAGSGITPIISIIKTQVEESNFKKIVLFYSNKTKSSTMFLEGLASLNEEHGNLSVYFINTKEDNANPLLKNRITKETLKGLTDLENINLLESVFFSCGPEDMILSISEKLKAEGVQESSINYELFYSKTDDNTTGDLSEVSKATIKIILDDEESTIDYNKTDGSILDAALSSKFDVPFSCKGAVCCTCKAKILEGNVKMSKNFALSDEEVEEGYVLACQSKPLSENVTLDFDVI